MGFFDFASSPVSADDPCGPDLDGNDEFDVLLADIEGKLPLTYSDFLDPVKQGGLKPGFDLQAELAPLVTQLKKSRDIRLLVAAAKLSVLGGDLERFCSAVNAMAKLSGEYWDEVHPRGTDGSFMLRESNLSGLAEIKTVVLPLQDAPFCTLRRLGKISYRTQLLANKAVPPRGKEPALDPTALRDGLIKHEEFEVITGAYQQLSEAAAGLAQIRTQFAEKAPGQEAPDFEKLEAVLTPYCAFLRAIVHEHDPALAPGTEAADAATGEGGAEPAGGGPAPAQVSAGDIASAAAAGAALKGIEAYFRLFEPSNPATLLVRQAQQLVGKSFIEAMVILNPQLAEKAAIKMGGEVPLAISSAQMKALAAAPGAAAAAGDAPDITVASRAEAQTHMQAIEKYYQRTEPSSPIPLLLTRARSYSGRDFAALVKELGP